MILSKKNYNFFKWFVQIVLPAFSAAYFSLSNIFDLNNATKVLGVNAILAVFIGSVLGISSKNYDNRDDRFDGDLVVVEGEDGLSFRLVLNSTPEILSTKDSLTFNKVVSSNLNDV